MSLNLQPNECVKIHADLLRKIIRLLTELAEKSIFEYIEMFYNRQRRHLALNYQSLLEYYKQASQTY